MLAEVDAALVLKRSPRAGLPTRLAVPRQDLNLKNSTKPHDESRGVFFFPIFKKPSALILTIGKMRAEQTLD
jgi:hypothetical protein